MKREEFELLKDSSLGHSLIKAGRLYSEYSFETLKEAIGVEGLRHSHLQLFAHIPFSGTTVVELAKEMNISKQAVSVLVNDLIEFNILLKKDNPSDKRSFLVSFNEDKGSGVFQGMKLLKSLDIELENLLGKNKSKQFQESLLKVISNFT